MTVTKLFLMGQCQKLVYDARNPLTKQLTDNCDYFFKPTHVFIISPASSLSL